MTKSEELTARFRNNGDIGAGVDLVKVLRSESDVDGALALANEIAGMSLTPVQRAELGIHMLNLGLFEKSISALELTIDTITHETSSYIVRLSLASALYSSGHYHSAHRISETLQQPRWIDANDRLLSDAEENWWRLHPDRLLTDQDIVGKRIVVVHDIGGVGDLFQFIRYVDNLRLDGAAQVYIRTRASLRTLVETKLGATYAAEGPDSFEWDYFCPLFALYARYQKSPFFPVWPEPYLAPPPSHQVTETLRTELERRDGRPRVGLVWRSATKVKHEPFRSMSLSTLAPLLQDQAIQWVSLQVDPLTDEEQAILKQFNVLNLGDELRSFQDTACALGALDLLISIDSAPVHLAGALGVDAWVLLAHAADYRWYADRRFTPWYPSVRLFRQARLGRWDNVLAELRDTLGSLSIRCSKPGAS